MKTLLLLLILSAATASGQKITALPALGEQPADADVMPIVDDSTGQTKKVTYAELSKWLDNGTDVYRLTGNVGIGMSSPGSKLEVTGDISQFNNGGDPFIQVGDTTDFKVFMQWDSIGDYGEIQTIDTGGYAGDLALQALGGNVGIGTASPASIFDIEGSGGNFQVTDIGNQLILTSGGVNYIQSSGASGSLRLRTGGANDRLIITSDGNVGIGTATPASELDVDGAITQSELSADPADPAEGHSVTWQSDGTGSGDDGDIMMKITAGGTTKTVTLVDFSAS